jgi:hypothetical protein
MLMQQRDMMLNHHQTLGHAFPLEQPGNVLVAIGVGQAI